MNGDRGRITIEWHDDHHGFVVKEGRRVPFTAALDGAQVWIRYRNRTFRLGAAASREASSGAGGRSSAQISAPMPGVVSSVRVSEGQAVVDGETVLVLEAMKMEHEVRSARAGVVSRVRVRAGTRVEAGELLVELEEP
jgi:biotin carboxyl carrier protein